MIMEPPEKGLNSDGARVPSEPVFFPGELKPGEELDQRYQIVELFARGGMACVYKATDLSSGGVVAIKIPHMRFESDPLMYARFQREEEIARRFDHPFLLKVFASDRPKSRPYLVMEFLEGETLDRTIASQRPMPEATAARITCQLCDALEHLERCGVVHRDLKPGNIMVCRDGSIRLFDFGVATALKLRRLTFAGVMPTMGTPDYMAPEQVRGRRSDHRADIYSLGAMLYEMLTGRVPFDGDDSYVVMQSRIAGDPQAPRQINPSLTPEIEEIVLRSLSRFPRDRYASAVEMKGHLEDYRSVPMTGRNRRLKPIRIRWWHANPWALRGILFSAGVLTFLVGFFFFAFWFFSRFGRR